MYVRVKRKDTTAFVYTDPYEQISALKSKVAAVLGVESELQLSFQDKNLDDSKTVNDSKLENDNVLWALLKNSGSFMTHPY
jgi:hypothetical protein